MNFDGRTITFIFGELDTQVPACAARIQKCQGSEYHAVDSPVMTPHSDEYLGKRGDIRMDGLERFLSAQDGVYSTALAELRAGQKRTHWMWFIFPQLRGLGRSAMAERYGIVSVAEAREYLIHPVLGSRLKDCVEAIMPLRDRTLHEILGSPDDLKFRSSMTLFAMVAPEDPLFRVALDRWCDGVLDPATLSLLGSDPEGPAWQTRDTAR